MWAISSCAPPRLTDGSLSLLPRYARVGIPPPPAIGQDVGAHSDPRRDGSRRPRRAAGHRRPRGPVRRSGRRRRAAGRHAAVPPVPACRPRPWPAAASAAARARSPQARLSPARHGRRPTAPTSAAKRPARSAGRRRRPRPPHAAGDHRRPVAAGRTAPAGGAAAFEEVRRCRRPLPAGFPSGTQFRVVYPDDMAQTLSPADPAC